MKNKNILLIRGLTQEAEHGPEFLHELQKKMKGYNIETLDIPGNGQHFRLKSFTSIKKNVLFLRDQWKKRISYPSENLISPLTFSNSSMILVLGISIQDKNYLFFSKKI